jgi:hypothetical protein
MSDRNICDVIDRVLAVIPAEHAESIRPRLTSLRSSASFSAPELMQDRWLSFAVILGEEVGPPGDVPWKLKVQAIFNGKE